MLNFDYLAQKILDAKFLYSPFKHLIINDFLSNEHFTQLTTHKQVKFDTFNTLNDVIETLIKAGYVSVSMPGGTSSIDEYINSLSTNNWNVDSNKMSGLGLVFKLQTTRDPFMSALLNYVNGASFHNSLRAKFALSESTALSAALHKYLTGYEISPHADSVKKAITMLVNVNTDSTCTNEHMHTQLLSFNDNRKYIGEFWKYNTQYDRDWLPWEWCKTEKIVNENNTAIIFSPSYNTLHGVKCKFDHLKYQRTLIYSNLFYTNVDVHNTPIVPYRNFNITPESTDDALRYRTVNRT